LALLFIIKHESSRILPFGLFAKRSSKRRSKLVFRTPFWCYHARFYSA